MAVVRRMFACALLAGLLVFCPGCEHVPKFSDWPKPAEVLHELKPHRLHRWNRYRAPSAGRNFSVDDPIPELEAGNQ